MDENEDIETPSDEELAALLQGRLHPEGAPGFIEQMIRSAVGDEAYERRVADEARERRLRLSLAEATVAAAEAKATVWRTVAWLLLLVLTAAIVAAVFALVWLGGGEPL